MRLTVELDEDVRTLIKIEMERSGESFKKVVNRAMRIAFNAAERSSHAESTEDPRTKP
jgi:hypothetical protein